MSNDKQSTRPAVGESAPSQPESQLQDLAERTLGADDAEQVKGGFTMKINKSSPILG